MELIVACAFERTAAGLRFLPETGVPDHYPRRCQLRAQVDPQAGSVASIEMRSWGSDYAVDVLRRRLLSDDHWRHLDLEAYAAAHEFLLLNHAHQFEEEAA